jgi:hypothetical protein
MEASISSREYEYVKNAFAADFYLWKIAQEQKDRLSEKDYLSSLKFYRTKVQDIFEEVNEFDAFLASIK